MPFDAIAGFWQYVSSGSYGTAHTDLISRYCLHRYPYGVHLLPWLFALCLNSPRIAVAHIALSSLAFATPPRSVLASDWVSLVWVCPV